VHMWQLTTGKREKSGRSRPPTQEFATRGDKSTVGYGARTKTGAALRIHWTALVFSSVNSAVQLLVPLYALHLGYPGLTIGILAALPSVANISLRVVAGRLSDRHGETRVLQAGGLFYLTATLGLLLSTAAGLAPFVCAQVLQGVGRSIFWTVGQAYVTKLPLERGQHLSPFNGATNLGMLLVCVGRDVCAGRVLLPGVPGAGGLWCPEHRSPRHAACRRYAGDQLRGAQPHRQGDPVGAARSDVHHQRGTGARRRPHIPQLAAAGRPAARGRVLLGRMQPRLSAGRAAAQRLAFPRRDDGFRRGVRG